MSGNTGIDSVTSYVGEHCAGRPDFSARVAAAALVDEFPWPGSPDEEWLRTPMRLFAIGERIAREPSDHDGTRTGESRGESGAESGESRGEGGPEGRGSSARSLPEGLAGRIRIENGRIAEQSLAPAAAAQGVVFGGLRAVLDAGAAVGAVAEATATATATPAATAATAATAALAAAAQRCDNRIIAWNNAMWEYGVVLYVPDYTVPPGVFEITIAEDSAAGTGLAASATAVVMPRVLVIVGTGATATVVERLCGTTDALVNAATDAVCGEGSDCRMSLLQELGPHAGYIGNVSAVVRRDARFAHFAGLFGASVAKVRVDTLLADSGADVVLNGVYVGSGQRHVDVRTVQRHVTPHARSVAFYKGLACGTARTVFQGLIDVAEGAVKTDAYLTNKNLILDNGAFADSIPTLMIRNNDVKCSHGSTTGKVDPQQLYYLQTRGFSAVEARRLLIAGYCEDVIATVPVMFQDEVRAVVEAVADEMVDQ